MKKIHINNKTWTYRVGTSYIRITSSDGRSICPSIGSVTREGFTDQDFEDCGLTGKNRKHRNIAVTPRKVRDYITSVINGVQHVC